MSAADGPGDGGPCAPGEDTSHPAAPLPGEEWAIGEDGMPFRHAARVVLFDAADRVLLVRGHDAHQVERSWWFTVGGGIDDGEDARAAAVRELREETGLALDPDALVGPVANRSAILDFFARSVRQEEVYFAARLDRVVTDEELRDEGWTEVERAFMDEIAWWPPARLAELGVEVFPAELVELVDWLRPGWDGVVRTLATEIAGAAVGLPGGPGEAAS